MSANNTLVLFSLPFALINSLSLMSISLIKAKYIEKEVV